MQELLQRFAASVMLDTAFCAKLIAAGFDKLKQYAPIFEINVASSKYCNSVQAWLDQRQEQEGTAQKQTA